MLSLLVGGGSAASARRPAAGSPISASGSLPQDAAFSSRPWVDLKPAAAGGWAGLLLVDWRTSRSPQFEGRSPLAGVGVATCCAFPALADPRAA